MTSQASANKDEGHAPTIRDDGDRWDIRDTRKQERWPVIYEACFGSARSVIQPNEIACHAGYR